jgi:hypothetical protein
MKAPHARARVGEERSPGDVRPVTTRSLVYMGVAMVVVVAAAISAIIVVSGNPKSTTSTANTPRSLSSPGGASGKSTSTSGTYRQTVQIPGSSAATSVVPATLTLNCDQICTGGRLSGFGGTFDLTTVFGRTEELKGSLKTDCESDTLVLTSDEGLAALPQVLNGTLTRTATCPGTSLASPVAIRLDRT